jgi:hypoxanthine phosphoribosyltransferase
MPRNLLDDIQETLISAEQIQQRVLELGAQISADYAASQRDIIFIGVLKGALMFMVDLARAVSLPISIDFMAVSSYGASTASSGIVRIMKDLDASIEGKDVVVIEDIVDSGLTLSYMLDNLRSRNPASLKVCALLNKRDRRTVDTQLDYLGFDVPDAFVVGYGLDYNQLYRNLPFIGVLKPELYK